MFCVICMLRSEAGRWSASTRGLKSTPSFLLMSLARQSELRNTEIGHVEVEAMIRKVHEMMQERKVLLLHYRSVQQARS
jgi:hypothetical protein